MKFDALSIFLVAVAGLAGGVSLLSENDLNVSIVAGALSALAAAFLAIRAMLGQLARPSATGIPVETDPLGGLREAMRSGPIGRERIVFTVQSLEFTSSRRTRPSFSQDEVRDLLALAPLDFRDWLSGRLERLERET